MTVLDGFRETVRSWISDSIEGYCCRTGIARIWGEPLVGLADADSPMFRELDVTAHRGHRVPQDYLPGAVTVVSYFLPFVRCIAEDNEGGDSPSGAWVDAYRITNDMAAELNERIASQIRAMGFSAAVPVDAGVIVDGTYSAWSQRHVARIAGLGTFGMNNMLITEAGCCGRFFSVVTDVPCDHDAPVEGDRCLHRLDGSCGACMRACPIHALGDSGFDRDACGERCFSNKDVFGEDVCGKCVVGMPCSFRDPSA